MEIYKFWHNANKFKIIDLEGTKLLNMIVDGVFNRRERINTELGTYRWIDNSLEESDFPMINGSMPVISKRAMLAMSSLLEVSEIECLPLSVENEKYYLLHFMKTYDVLNVHCSKISYFKDGNIKNIEKYVFLPTVKETPPIFQILQTQMFSFVKEEVYNVIRQAGLKGADFEKCLIKDVSIMDKFFKFAWGGCDRC